MSYCFSPATKTSVHKTAPLPYKLENNHIYNPFNGCEGPELKRSKSCNKLLKVVPTVKRFQRRKSRVLSNTLRNNSCAVEDLSEHEFSFSEEYSISSPQSPYTDSDNDLESLPESDVTTPNTSPSTNKTNCNFPFFISRNPQVSQYFEHQRARQFQLHHINDVIIDEDDVEIVEAPPSIFLIPEILNKIIGYVDAQNSVIPQEGTTVRRKPLSFKHAMMIYGNQEDARSAMAKQMESLSGQFSSTSSTLFNCLLVNKLFHQVTKEYLSKKFYFSSELHYMKYIHQQQKQQKNCIQVQSPRKASPSMIVLHKLFLAKSDTIEILNQSLDYSNLEWIEFFMCPKLLPSTLMFDTYGHKIKKFIVTGSKVLDDSFLIHLSKRCPNLEVLDIRACELVTDSGIYSIGKYCKKLRVVNFGRKLKGHLITDNSLSLLIKNNTKLNTIGLAGCDITDKVIWDIAIHGNQSIERLSLNNCKLITNQSIPLILHSNYLPNLSVLELRFIDNLTNFLPIIEFKRRQESKGISILIEVCEALCLKMKQQEIELDRAISKRIFKDISEYVNNDDDEDNSHINLINQRRLQIIS